MIAAPWLARARRATLGAGLALAVQALAAQTPSPRAFVPDSHARPAQTFGAVQVLPVRGDVYMAVGPGGNSTIQIGSDGVVVVDTGTAAAGEDLAAAIRALSPRPIRQIINTHGHDDHAGGNEAVARAGRFLGAGNARNPTTFLGSAPGASVLAHESVLRRMVDRGGESGGWPTETFFVGQKDLYVNGEAIQLVHYPAAHGDGDVVAFFRRSDVISTGDLFTPDRYPVIDLQQGGSIEGLLSAINALLVLAIPDFNEEGGTLLVPGHGRITDESDLSDYRDMVTIVRDRVQDMIRRKATIEQVRAARLTRDYDGVYASDAHTGDMFVTAVYRSLTQPPRGTGR